MPQLCHCHASALRKPCANHASTLRLPWIYYPVTCPWSTKSQESTSWWLLVNNGGVTKAKSLDATRIRVFKDRVESMLAAQPGAEATYDTGVQQVARSDWWDDKRQRVSDALMLAHLANMFPLQPLSGVLGQYPEIAVEALLLAERSERLARWTNQTQVRRAAKQTGRSVSGIRRMARIFDYSDEESADFELREVLTRLRNVKAHYEIRAQLVREAIREMSLNPEFVTHPTIERRATRVSELVRSVEALVEEGYPKTPRGFRVSRSFGEWSKFESEVSVKLVEIGVPKKDVNNLLRRPGADKLLEKGRLSRNRRRKAKLTAKKKPMTRKKALSRTRRLTKQ